MKQYIPQYEQYLISQAKSVNTVKTYVSDVEQYFKVFERIDRESIQQYKEYMKKNDLSSVTVNRKLSSIKSFNEFLLGECFIESVVVLKKDFIKVQEKGNPTDVTEKQVAKFLQRVNEKPNMYKSRNMALINLIANTGIRREEACNLKLKNIDFNNGELNLIGKGNKERTILLSDKVIELIKIYLEDRSKQKYADSPYLFISERGEKLHKDSINSIFEFYYTPKCKVGVHQLRHNMATSAIEQGVLTLPELQDQLGHAQLNTVGIYAKARKSSIRKKINKLQIG